jgi:hypothetical protein
MLGKFLSSGVAPSDALQTDGNGIVPGTIRCGRCVDVGSHNILKVLVPSVSASIIREMPNAKHPSIGTK